jgi:hypothetical protein
MFRTVFIAGATTRDVETIALENCKISVHRARTVVADPQKKNNVVKFFLLNPKVVDVYRAAKLLSQE